MILTPEQLKEISMLIGWSGIDSLNEAGFDVVPTKDLDELEEKVKSFEYWEGENG